MAKQASFDIVSEINPQEIDNAVNQAVKEISTRYDLKNAGAKIDYDRQALSITMEAADEYSLKSCLDVLIGKAVKRGVAVKALKPGRPEAASMGRSRLKVDLVAGISKDKARELTKLIKELKFKVEVVIEGEKLRVSSKSRDELQAVIAALKEKDFDIPLQFVNYR